MRDDRSGRGTALLGFFSIVTVAFVFQLQGRLGFGLADEGFLWYGAQRVMLGEVPIRDFMSYDPGRYYWSAAIMSLLGDDGIIANRIAVALFQAIGLFLCLFLLAREGPVRLAPWLLSGTIFLLWMFPRHKLFDITVSIALVATLSFLIEKPSRSRFYLTGLVIGIAAVFGRNHGLYGAIGFIGAVIYLKLERHSSSRLENLAWWIGGALTGYSPVILCLFVAPGFAKAFAESVQFLFEYKRTNLPLPIPWLWHVDFQQNWSDSLRDVLIGSFFVAILAFFVLGLSALVRAKRQNTVVPSVFAAAVLLALPYAHFAFSRADVSHLAQGIFPFLIGVLVAVLGASSTVGILSLSVLLVSSLIVMLPQQPGWQFYRDGNWLSVTIASDKLNVDPGTAHDVALLSMLVKKYAPDGGAFIATPFWPGAYAAFERKSPMWEIYAVLPRNQAFQEREIQRIRQADPGFVLVLDHALDGREDLRFRNTHPLVNNYINSNYEQLDEFPKGKPLRIYIKKQRGQIKR